MKYSSKRGSETYKIAVAGVMLALILILVFIRKLSVIAIFTFLKIDLTTIVLVAMLLLIGWKYTIAVGFLKFCLAPLLSGSVGMGYLIALIGESAALIATFGYVAFFAFGLYLAKKALKIRNKTNNIDQILVNNRKSVIIFALVFSSVFTIFIITLLNGLIITPLYFYALDYSKTAIFTEISNNWINYKELFFELPTYWSGIFSFYTAFNAVQFAIITFVLSVSLIALDPVYNLIHFTEIPEEDLDTPHLQKDFHERKTNLKKMLSKTFSRIKPKTNIKK